MPAEFLDTNILVYAYDPTDKKKQKTAQSLLERSFESDGTISTQVLGEFAATLLHKMSPPAKPESVQRVLDVMGPLRVVTPTPEIVRRAAEAHREYGVHFYDGMVIAAAERAGCKTIWSEDLSDGQEYFGVTVRNPFR
jgi:predicted nucleic acid-binding protein